MVISIFCNKKADFADFSVPGRRGCGWSGGTLVSNVPLLHAWAGLILGGALHHGHSWYILPGRGHQNITFDFAFMFFCNILYYDTS